MGCLAEDRILKQTHLVFKRNDEDMEKEKGGNGKYSNSSSKSRASKQRKLFHRRNEAEIYFKCYEEENYYNSFKM